MPFDARTLTVIIASPGDVLGARDAIEQELHEWNSVRSAATGTILQPRRWRRTAFRFWATVTLRAC